jgi:organic hydroperoxide reductase OsmC/OhrA
MKPLPHHYQVRLAGGPAGHAIASVDGAPDLRTAPPADFGGPGDAWSPEHLFLASLETCFLFTLQSVAQASRVPFTSATVSAEGTVDRQEGVTRFTEVVLRPRLVVPAGVDRERALRIMQKSEAACLITASVKTPIRLEPEIVTA